MKNCDGHHDTKDQTASLTLTYCPPGQWTWKLKPHFIETRKKAENWEWGATPVPRIKMLLCEWSFKHCLKLTYRAMQATSFFWSSQKLVLEWEKTKSNLGKGHTLITQGNWPQKIEKIIKLGREPQLGIFHCNRWPNCLFDIGILHCENRNLTEPDMLKENRKKNKLASLEK